MALLAYDPQQVARLRQALSEATTDLRRLTCTDPAAQEAMRVVRSAVAQLDAIWLPLVERLLTADPLSVGQRRAANINSLDHSLVRVMADGYGWSVQTDPLADNIDLVTVEEARALAVSLNSVEPSALANDSARLAWLAQQLAVIGSDPSLSAEFLANFHNWNVLPCVLAQQRAQSYGVDYTGDVTSCELDSVLNALMAIWRHTLPAGTLHAGASTTLDQLLPPMDNPDPYVQALMLRSLHLEPIALATVTVELLRTWLDNKELLGDGSLDLDVAYGPNVADLLLPDIAGNPVASAYFLSLISDRPALLFETLDDPEIGYRLALAGTQPALTPAPAAEKSVLAILAYFDGDLTSTSLNNDGYAGDYGAFLGQLVAPWLLQFAGANVGWKASDAMKTHLLSVALNDEQALQALVATSQRMAEGFALTLTTAHSDEATLALSAQIGGLMSLLGQLVVNEHVHDESERTHFLWDLTWTVLTAATNFVPGGAVANVAAGGLVLGLQSALAERFAQNDPDGVRHDGEYAMDVAVTVTAAFMMTAMFQSWLDDGRVGKNVAPPPLPRNEGCVSSEYRNDVDQWLTQLPPQLRHTASDLVNSFIGGPQAKEHCAELNF